MKTNHPIKYLFIVLGGFLLLISCKKENNTNSTNKIHFMVTGTVNENIKNTDSEKTISTSEISCLHAYGKDSLDVNLDSIFDCRLIINQKSPDIYGECCIPTNPPVECLGDNTGYRAVYLELKNPSLELAVDANGLIKQLNLGDTLSSKTKWDKQQKYYFENVSYPNSFKGIWTDVNDKYFGFRIVEPDTIYGWAKVSTKYNAYTIKQIGVQQL